MSAGGRYRRLRAVMLAGGLGMVAMPGTGQPALEDAVQAASAPEAPQGATYAVSAWTIDGGGGRSAGGAFEIQGTMGQPDADPLQPSAGGAFEVSGGFWPGLSPATPQPDAVFANGFE